MSKLKLVICLALILSGFIVQKNNQIVIQATQSCSSEEECRDAIESSKEELDQLKKEEAKKEDELASVELDINSLLIRIEETQKEIQDTTLAIKKAEEQIKKSEAELAILNEDITGVKDAVGVRMRVSQRLSRFNIILSYLSEAESLADLVRSMRNINSFAQSDKDQMESLKTLVIEQQEIQSVLQVEKDSLATQQEALVSNQKSLEEDQLVLVAKQDAVKEEIQKLESEQMSASEALAIAQEQKALLEKLAAEEEARRLEEEKRKEEEALKDQNNNNAESNGGSNSDSSNNNSSSQPQASGFIIPLATGYVSCEFMCYPNHTGIDLANSGNTNTPVIAAATGIVVRSGWHSAYGNHVIISHNVNGKIMTTVYAHMHTAPLVSVGDTVTQGQKLGTMGNTGNSFGAHLHFEMYEGYYNYPNAVNPRKYINFPSRW